MKKFLILGLFVVGLWFALTNFQGLAQRGNYDSLVLNFRNDLPRNALTRELEAIADRFGVAPQLNSIFSEPERIFTIEGDRAVLDALRNWELLQKYTEYIEPNYIYQAFEAPNDPEYAKQWNFRNINLEAAWAETQGEGITVAVIDTGVSQVPDLEQTEFAPGYDFVNDKIDASDDSGHGTHVAGTIAQSTNNNYGVAGIAYKAKIMPIKVLGPRGGTIADIAEGIRFAAENGADVINMSLGGSGESKLMQEAIDYAYEQGVVLVAAAGNSGQNAAAYPARYPRVIGVSATDSADQKAPYSNYGAGVDIAAPGGSESGKVLQETIDPSTGKPKFASLQGTSMAAPHVAGVAALVKAAGISEPEEVLNVLKESVRKVGEDPKNYFGAGHLDASAAVKLALKGQITFKDFFRWLRDNGYLNPRFWIDGGTIALIPKLIMVIGSYLLAWLLRNYFPLGWSWPLSSGLIAGSSGIFILRGFYVFDLPQWPFRVLGSSIPELGSALQGSPALNPLFASVFIPFVLVLFLLAHPMWKWFAVGTALGVASCLGVHAAIDPAIWGLGSGWFARFFLIANALLCVALARFVSRDEKQFA